MHIWDFVINIIALLDILKSLLLCTASLLTHPWHVFHEDAQFFVVLVPAVVLHNSLVLYTPEDVNLRL